MLVGANACLYLRVSLRHTYLFPKVRQVIGNTRSTFANSYFPFILGELIESEILVNLLFRLNRNLGVF